MPVGLPFGIRGAGFFFALEADGPLFEFAAVNPLMRRTLPAFFGLLLRVLALCSKLDSELSSSSGPSSSIVGGDRIACFDCVIGAK